MGEVVPASAEEDPVEEASEEVEEGAGSRSLESPTAGLSLMALLERSAIAPKYIFHPCSRRVLKSVRRLS